MGALAHQPALDANARRRHAEPILIQCEDEILDQVRVLESRTGRPPGALVELALGLLETVLAETDSGRRVLVTNRFGWPVKQLVIPGSEAA